MKKRTLMSLMMCSAILDLLNKTQWNRSYEITCHAKYGKYLLLNDNTKNRFRRERKRALRFVEKTYREVGEVTMRERLHNGSGAAEAEETSRCVGWRGWLTGNVQRKSRRKSFSSKPRPRLQNPEFSIPRRSVLKEA